MSSLDLNTITDLLKSEGSRQPRVLSDKSGTGTKERPFQLGPLRWMEKSDRCASRGCGGTTHIQIEGVPRCMTHALYVLNYMLLQTHSDYEDVAFTEHDCSCKAGRYSTMNLHTPDCALYTVIKEHKEQSDNSSAS